ncbi:ANTAR domain-containing protein [Amycolatopsis sp. K13G38]|uniref:ANTAR domain-containing protein n=1 Tax=Amycolatopsis acididurans TaxID=2724524 RepID=A0ABX1JGV5_9PSEU|nr:ANTAR domain-containing protein [Amycolatopsis acididurans]NKQ59037.1 ANTAR domain-containing protein [Amycolatopsis acididurans]
MPGAVWGYFLPDHVHQATGMAAVQLQVSVDLAFALLCLEAEIQRVPVTDLAARVVSRTFHFEERP